MFVVCPIYIQDFIYKMSFASPDIDGLLQDSSNSSALAVELLQSCTKSSMCFYLEIVFTVSMQCSA